MAIVEKKGGKLPMYKGDWEEGYNDGKGYNKTNRVTIFGSELESLIDGNTHVPATQDSESGKVTFSEYWKVISNGSDAYATSLSVKKRMEELEQEWSEQNRRMDNMQAAINEKQLEIGAVPTDEKPRKGSGNILTSGSVYDALKPGGGFVDDIPTVGSENLVTSGGVLNNIFRPKFSFIGDGKNLVWSDAINVIPGSTYRVTPINDSSFTGLTGYKLLVCTEKNVVDSRLLGVEIGTDFSDYYDITIPENTSVIYVAIREVSGVKFSIYLNEIQDIPSLYNTIELKGNDNNIVSSEAIKVTPGVAYNIIIDGDIPSVQDISGYVLGVNTVKNSFEGAILGVQKEKLGIWTHNFTVPDGVESVYVLARLNIGKVLKFHIAIDNRRIGFTTDSAFNAGINDLKIASAFYEKEFGYSYLGIQIMKAESYNGMFRNAIFVRKDSKDISRFINVFSTEEDALANFARTYRNNDISLSVNDALNSGIYTLKVNTNSIVGKIDLGNIIDTHIFDSSSLNTTRYAVNKGHRYTLMLDNTDYDRSSLSGYLLRIYGIIDGKEYPYAEVINDSDFTNSYNFYVNGDVDEVYVGLKAPYGTNITGKLVDTTLSMDNSISFASYNSSVSDKNKADIVVSEYNAFITTIQKFIDLGFNVKLYGGSYYVNSPINVNKDNIVIEGIGDVTINRTGVQNGYVIKDGTAVKGVTLKNIKANLVVDLFTNNESDYITYDNLHSSNINVDAKFNIINNSSLTIAVGKGKDVEKFEDGYNLAVYAWTLKRFSDICLHIYGKHILDSKSFTISSRGISIYGMTEDATLEVIADSPLDGFTFADTNGLEAFRAEIKNIHFVQSGSYGSWQKASVLVRAKNLYFENCVFENKASYTEAYHPKEDDNSLRDGDRKQGCIINIDAYGDECNTIFRNCTGIGSTYGFKNCRGFYIIAGSPKLYNCTGIGGGIGRRGYGIICHAASRPLLVDCTGIGSPYGWGLCNGIQFQASSQATLMNCIAYGGTGYQHISNGGTDIVNQGTISEESHGYGFLMDVSPKLINCVGYAGDGEGSSALYTENVARPDIIGGFYGKERKIWRKLYAANKGTYMTFENLGNNDRDIYIDGIYLRDLSGSNVSSISKFVISVGSKTIAESTSKSTENWLTINDNFIKANDVVELHVKNNNGDDIADGFYLDVFVRYRVDNKMSCALLTGGSCPTVRKAAFEGNENSDGFIINTNSDKYIFSECDVRIPATRHIVKSSSAKNDVKVVKCLMSSKLTENINSFVDVETLGSNGVV